jgi:hypothetical protein
MQNESSIPNQTIRTNRFEIGNSIKITGPGQMMQELVDYFPKSDAEDVLFVWLDSLDQAVGIDQVAVEATLECKISPQQEFSSADKLIVVSRGRTKSRASEMADTLEIDGLALLDVLLVADGKWWSKLCKDPDCCPLDGRVLPNRKPVDSDYLSKRHEIWFQWLTLVQSFSQQSDVGEVASSQESILRNSLDDLAIRDCALNHLAINRDSQPVWIRICKQFLAGSQTHNNHVLYCLLAAIYFSNDDSVEADFYTKQSLLIEPKYSLALLMQHGLEIKMDCKKVVAAFTHFTPEELLENTPVRNGDKK